MAKYLLAALLLAVALPAGAQTGPSGPNPVREGARERARDLEQSLRERAEETRENARALAETAEQMRLNFQAQREEVKARFEARREEFRAKAEENREAAAEALKAKRADFEAKLQTIKDERKRQLTERIGGNLVELNTRLTSQMGRKLDQMDGVLERIISRTDKAEVNGRNVAEVRAAITAANAALAKARAAVAEQVGRTYVIAISEESRLKADIQNARDGLHRDLRTVHEAVKAAHAAVRDAATTLAKIPGVDALPPPGSQPTGTASTTNP